VLLFGNCISQCSYPECGVADRVGGHCLSIFVGYFNGADQKAGLFVLVKAEIVGSLREAWRVVVDVDHFDVDVDGVFVGVVFVVAIGAVFGNEVLADVGTVAELVGDLVEWEVDVKVVSFYHGDHFVQITFALRI